VVENEGEEDGKGRREHDIAVEGAAYKDSATGEGGSACSASQPPPSKIAQEKIERAEPGRNKT